jgi:hypothetical protein
MNNKNSGNRLLRPLKTLALAALFVATGYGFYHYGLTSGMGRLSGDVLHMAAAYVPCDEACITRLEASGLDDEMLDWVKEKKAIVALRNVLECQYSSPLAKRIQYLWMGEHWAGFLEPPPDMVPSPWPPVQFRGQIPIEAKTIDINIGYTAPCPESPVPEVDIAEKALEPIYAADPAAMGLTQQY